MLTVVVVENLLHHAIRHPGTVDYSAVTSAARGLLVGGQRARLGGTGPSVAHCSRHCSLKGRRSQECPHHCAGWSGSPSPVLVPFIGPWCLTLAILLNDLSLWLMPIARVTDLGTWVAPWYLPRIIRQVWETPRLTCQLRIKGSIENDHAY